MTNDTPSSPGSKSQRTKSTRAKSDEGNVKKSSAESERSSETEAVGAGVASELSNKDRASSVVNRYALLSAGGGVVPVPFLDMAVISGVQVKMLNDLCEVYGIEFNSQTGRVALGALVSSLGVFPLIQRFLTSGLKAVPGVGQVLAFTAGPAAAAGSTYGIGRIFSDHFEEGGGLLDVDMGKAKRSFKNLYKRGKEKFIMRGKKVDASASNAIVA